MWYFGENEALTLAGGEDLLRRRWALVEVEDRRLPLWMPMRTRFMPAHVSSSNLSRFT